MSAPRKREPSKSAFRAAVTYEKEIADDAAKVRGAATELTGELFLKLLPIACQPIPEGFILYVSAGDGKPYASTGVRSVQVQIARMDAVFTPLWWSYETNYSDDGKLAEVTVTVNVEGNPVTRSAWGGVDRANTQGNLRKGAFTNAAKVAFARLGVGGEVYLGATDHDPDSDPAAAKAQVAPASANTPAAAEQPLSPESQDKILTAFTEAGIANDLALYLRAVGAASLEEVTAAQAYQLREHLDAYATKKAAS